MGYEVKGKSINDLLNMEIDTFNKLTTQEMRQVVSRMASASNKRARNLAKQKNNSPAYNRLMSSGGAISTKNKNLSSLRKEYLRAKNFLTSKSSTVRGWKQIQKDTSRKLKEMGIGVSTGNLQDFFSVYEKLKELDPSITNKELKYRVMGEIAVMDNELSVEERVMEIYERLNEIYEEKAVLEDEFTGISEFFEM